MKIGRNWLISIVKRFPPKVAHFKVCPTLTKHLTQLELFYIKGVQVTEFKKLFLRGEMKKRAQMKFLDYDATLRYSTIFTRECKLIMFFIPAFLLSSYFVN